MINRDVKQLNLNQLKHRLKAKGLKTKGRKRDLIKRLQDSEFNDMDKASDARQRSKPGDTNGLIGFEKSSNSTDHDPANDMIEMLHEERKEREGIVLWKKPITTLQYFCIETLYLVSDAVQKLWKRKKTVIVCLILLLVLAFIYNLEGSHQQIIAVLKKNVLWWAYWVGLGILSSVGLGTGLHTFLLYLGPHIAAVTLAAFECNSVDFPEPPYPNDIVCPEGDTENNIITIWTIMNKVRLEAVMWGAGTAIGELPPYFMARAARLSGADLDSDDFEEIEELIHEKKVHPDDMGFLEKAKLGVHNLVQRIGFFGILVCASIPNPLFDLAGITCGHFLVPFWTFFGATLIGKAIIKMHIQKIFVIFLFSVHHVEKLIELIGMIPVLGESVQTPFKDYLEAQKKKLHHKPGSAVASESNLLGWIFEKVVIIMVAYFILSIVNSTAQSYHKRLCKEKHKKAQH